MEKIGIYVTVFALIVAGFAFGFAVSTATQHNTTSIEYHDKSINQLLSAANGAAHCGGYVVIDADDGEVLVGGCDT